jgi:hypothetical protein
VKDIEVSDRSEEYSQRTIKKLKKNLKRYEKIETEILSQYFESKKVEEIISQIRSEYEKIISTIPYIGGKENDMTEYLLLPSALIPLVKLLIKEGLKTREIGKIIVESAEKLYQKLPKPFRWYLRRKLIANRNINEKKKGAEWSQKRIYPMDWVYEFIDGEGEDFEYGINMKECGLLKYWNNLGLEEYVPYLCLTDWVLWDILNVKTTRTTTLANGGDVCDYRYYKGKYEDGPKGWPPEYHIEWTGIFEKDDDG